MTESIAPERSRSHARVAAGRTVARLPWLLLAGWAAQAAIRLWLARAQMAPIVYPDESGYLVAARWLTGGPGGDFSGSTFYQGGYPLLLTPAYLIGGDLETVYRLAVGITSLVGAAIFPLGYLLLVRLGLSRRPAFALAWAAALLPATTLFGEAVLADGVLPVIVLGWLLALDHFIRHGGVRSAALASLIAAYAHATHMRGTIVLAVHVVVLLAYAVRGQARSAARAGLAVAAAGYAAATLLNAPLRAALYPDGPKNHAGILRDHVASFDGQLWALSGAAGQVWAFAIGTWGLGAVGLVAVVATAIRRTARRDDRIMAGVLLTVTAGIAYASMAALPDEHRVGNFAYGRYLGCVALVYTLAGLVVLLRGRAAARQTAIAIGLIAMTGLWVVLYAGDRLRTNDFFGWDFPEAGFLGFSYTAGLRIPLVSVVASVLLLIFWGLSRWGIRKLVAGLLVVNSCALLVMTASLTQPISEPIPPVAGAPSGGVLLDRNVLTGNPKASLVVSRVALAVSWTKFEWFDARRDRPHAGVCSAIVLWPVGAPPESTWPAHPAGWRFHASDVRYTTRWVVWYDPACPR